MGQQKKVFKFALAILAVLMVVLPFVVSMNELVTKLVEGFGWYAFVEEYVVPWEVKLVGVVVEPLGIDFVAYPEGFTAEGIYAKLSWNCLGWQSLLLFLISLPIGFGGGDYTWFSKGVAFGIGILGTFLVNLARIVLTVVILVVSRPLFAIVFHDYLAALVTVLWLVVFWWFVYAFVLEEKRPEKRKPEKGLKLLRNNPLS